MAPIAAHSPSPSTPHRSLLVAAALAVALAALPAGPASAAPATYRVNSPTDVNDGTCNAAHCSLREAILAANGHGGTDTIAFNLPAGSLSIAVLGALPAITGPVTVDGGTQPGYAGSPLVVVNGGAAGPADGLVLTGSGAVVRGLAVRAFQRAGVALAGTGQHTVSRSRIEANGGDGIRVDGGAGNLIGGSAAAGNAVLSNGGAGVRVAAGTGNAIRANAISANGGLGIDLGPAGEPIPSDPNDPGDADTGPNNRQNAPTLALAGTSPARAMVHGGLSSVANRTFSIDLFVGADCDPSGRGEGQAFLGSTFVTTNGAGVGSFSFSYGAALAATTVGTATATDASGNTSEFSACQRVLASSNAAAAARIAETTYSFGATTWDYDDDGDEDLFLNRHYRDLPRFYRNDDGGFTEIMRGDFPMVDYHGCDTADVNVDGRLDLFCAEGAHYGTGFKRNDLFIQQADHTFVNRAAEYGVTDPAGRGRYPAFLDVNHDPYPDLFVGNDYPRQDDIPSPNRLYLNQGGTSFVEVPEYGLTKEVAGWCAVPADLDGDGWEDLVVCGKQGDWGLRIYRNVNGTKFNDVTRAWGVSCADCRDAEVADLDHDGRLDLLQVGKSQLVVQRGVPGGLGPRTVIRALTYGWRSALGDVNGDGWLDIYALNSNSAPPNPPDVMLVNLTGMRFAEVPIPQTSIGRGEDAVRIDRDGDGVDGFVVLNGGSDMKGPVLLIEFTPPSG